MIIDLENIKHIDYKMETDVFFASRLLLELIQKPGQEEPILYTLSKTAKKVFINEDTINTIYMASLPTIDKISGTNVISTKAFGIECGS